MIRPVSVTVAGKWWRQVPDLSSAGPNDPFYELSLDDDGSLCVRFGDGRRGTRPPAGEILVRAQYRGRRGQGWPVTTDADDRLLTNLRAFFELVTIRPARGFGLTPRRSSLPSLVWEPQPTIKRVQKDCEECTHSP
jgi:hypothetical protein